jgi:hypothetical protein
MAPQELLELIGSFALKKKAGTVDLREFLGDARPAGSEREIEEALRQLERDRSCILSPAVGPIRMVTLPGFPILALMEEYKTLSVDPSHPFPTDETLTVPIPPADIQPVDVKKDFSSFISGRDKSGPAVARLLFPEGIDSLVVPRGAAGPALVEAAAAKISGYLQDPRNAGYAESKLVSLVKGNDIVVRQMMEDAASKPKKAAASILAPSDFAFRFWTHLANLILQDFRKKKEKTSQDHGVCQSAFIVGYYVFFQKGLAQREQERATDMRSLETLVRKPPYAFTFEDMYGLRDEKGVPFVNKHTRSFIHAFLDEKTRRVSGEALPFIVRVHAATVNKDYFIQKDLLVPVFLRKLTEAAEELREAYLGGWETALRRRQATPAMRSDGPFQRDVEVRVKEGYPLLGALANGPILLVAREETNLSETAAAEIGRCFAHGNTLKPLAECMMLSRTELYTEARSRLPLWETMPIVAQIVGLFRRLFSGRKQKEEPDKQPAAKVLLTAVKPPAAAEDKPAAPAPAAKTAASASPVAREREALLRYTRAIKGLVEHYVPKGMNIDLTLDELSNKWNPLFAEAQKADLVEDVNALVRDYLRPVRRTFLVSPPDLDRIKSLAAQLVGAKSLAKIKKREPLQRYIELYMVKCLEPKKKTR